MKTQKFIAPSKREAMEAVRRYFGPEAVIVSDRQLSRGIEVVAAPPEEDPGVTDRLSSGRAFGRHDLLQSAPPAVATDSLRAELKSLRNLVEDQFGALFWREEARLQPYRGDLLRRLLAFGLPVHLCTALADSVTAEESLDLAWTRAMSRLLAKVQVEKSSPLDSGGVVALTGPTGVGKTTTAAKLAGQFLMRHGAGSVGFITTDDYRLGAQEQLLAFARILDVPVLQAADQDELESCVRSLGRCPLTIIDTEGLKHARRDRVEAASGSRFRYSEVAKVYVLMQSGVSGSALRRCLDALAGERLSGCILTKLDECPSLGSVLNAAICAATPIGFLSDGQQVPTDLRAASHPDLAEIVDNFADPDAALTVEEHVLAASFSKRRTNTHA